MSLPIYTICEPCGALVHDTTVHDAFHARLDASAQAMQERLAEGMAVLHLLAPDAAPAPVDGPVVVPISGRDVAETTDSHPTTKGATS